MQNKYSRNNINIFLIIIIYVTFFLGFYFKEFSAGGSKYDFYRYTWPALNFFKENLFHSLLNYGEIVGDANFPIFYIINIYLNPLIFNQEYYFISSLLVGLITVLVFFKILLIHYKDFSLDKTDIFLTSSLILLLPFYSTRIFFGTSANLGWLFLFISVFFFRIYLCTENIKTLFFVCLFSALALYCRPALIFFAVYIYFYVFFVNKNIRNILVTSLFFTILALPGIFIIFLWLSNPDIKNIVTHPWTDSVSGGWFHYSNYVKNILIIGSYFFFYTIPIIFGNFRFYFSNFFNIKELLIFFIIIIFCYLYFELVNPSIFNNLKYGGGIFLKLDNIFLEKTNLIFILFGSIGIYQMIYLSRLSASNLILIISIITVYGLSSGLYQDYFEPLIFIFCIAGVINLNNKIEIRTLNIYYLFYFFIYLIGTIYYQNFFI